MKTKIQLKNKHTIQELKEAIKKSNDEGQKTRLRAMIYLKKGNSNSKTARDLTISRVSLIEWIKEYNDKGIAGLIFSKGGRPEGNPKWNKKIFDDLAEEIKKSNQCWSITAMQDWIKKHKKQEIPTTTVWFHLKQLDFSYKSARPHPYKGNKEAQEVFKKRGSKKKQTKKP